MSRGIYIICAEAATRRRAPFHCVDRVSLAPFCLHCSYLPSVSTYVQCIFVFRRIQGSRFNVMLPTKWQWPGQGIERAGECRAVVGILGVGGITATEGHLLHLRELNRPYSSCLFSQSGQGKLIAYVEAINNSNSHLLQ
ncbi:hypothetical protein J6590_066343 [Homalodisca vitripennis]|nr:hypothetical protein J6590_066343 [Homalodisca vitripennis]